MNFGPALSAARSRSFVASLFSITLAVTFALLVAGCTDSADYKSAGTSIEPAASITLQPNKISSAGSRAGEVAALSESLSNAQGEAAKQRPSIPRKIIYDAHVELQVESLPTAEGAVLALIKEHDGFLAESDQSNVVRSQGRATWKVRIPVDRFDAFLAAVNRFGEVRQSHVGTQDVTEEYVDIEARVRNKKEEEKRLLKHLADSTGKLEDILAVERELSRVRGEIEQMQGRIRFLTNRTELSTITIEAVERRDYKPPIAATFPTQLGRTFFESLDNLVRFGKTILVITVALLPWLPLIVVVALLARWFVHVRQRSARSDPKVSTQT